MLTKNVDQVVIGKSTFSVLLGLQLLQSGSNVLFLDDDRMGYGDLYERFISETTMKSLQAWGEELSVDPLINIHKYRTPSQHYIHLNCARQSIRVKLSSSPTGNMLELARKLGYPEDKQYFPESDSFDEEVLASLSRLGKHLYRFQTLSQLDAKIFTGQIPKDLVDWAEPIIAPFLGRKQLNLNRPWDAFFYVARAIYHQKFSLDFSTAEIWHLLIEAISPRYELDATKLVSDLVDVYQLRGGQFKATRVREWMFYKSAPWSLELSSYEGIIHPKKLILMGSHSSPIGLELEPGGNSYISVSMDFESEQNINVHSVGTRHFVFSPENVGTDFGLWSMKHLVDGKMKVEVAIRKREGMKIEFVAKQLISMSQVILDEHFSLNKFKPVSNKLKQERELWIDEHFHKPRKLRGELLLPAKIKLKQVLAPGSTETVKNVMYFGPGRRDRLGLISSLIDMKDSLPRLQ